MAKSNGHVVDRLDGLADIARDHAPTPSEIDRILAAAREHLGMEVAFVSEFAPDGRQRYRALAGDVRSFGWEEESALPMEQTFCKRMIDGGLSNVVRDAKHDERVNDLEVVWRADIGAYVGVPLRFSDGRLYGTMCCISHEPELSLRERDVKFMRVLARLLSDHLERQELESEKRRLEARAASVGALLASLETRDGYTGAHSRAVVDLSVAEATAMGLRDAEIGDVEQATLLHDLGKMGVPDAILNKAGPLTASEWRTMREHPLIGARIVASVSSLEHLAPVIRAEHERWDGAGYPHGLKGEKISLASRIVFACDAYHAMTSDRPYREAMSDAEAREELVANAGSQFCPRTVWTLLEVLDR
jgi:response regulator RpfG family c-di-GMP phosphodiesterase